MRASFYSRLAEHANSERAAIVAGSLELSYPELFERIGQGAAYLRGQGIDKQSVIGLSVGNEVDHLLATLSVMAVGAAHIVLASHDPEPARMKIASRARLTHTLSDDPAFAIQGITHVSWPDQLPTASASITPGGEATLLLRTSGTTGDMNIIPFSEEQLALQSDRHADYAHERLLRLASIEFNNSKRHRLYCVWAGGTNVFRTKEMTDIIDFALQHKVTCLDISRMHASDLAAMADAKKLAHVKIRTGGSAVPTSVRQTILDNVTPHLYVRYATSEFGAVSMAGPGDHDDDETVGRPVNGVDVEIIDANDQPLPTGQSGEIRLRSPGMATGYFDSPDDTAKRFRNGWFYPGDAGLIRADGKLVIQGRTDDMMVLNGVNIFPAEIEQVLEKFPGVAQAVALALTSTVHGQIPVAVVEPQKGIELSLPDLRAFAKDHLTTRAPRKIIFVESMPRSNVGKISRRELLNLFQPASLNK